ncbi:glycerophosphodiester phosphodiesterase family protein [Paenisporosarcina sp. TG20]|uniref:glycerophosphodiester phosphodiesterase n=1 Tax=Paenisporosarcina sp. TG20 TaxID=1211706 RepID=UPI0002FBF277|nr:glycerophosphodiester phosphodiesterase family protein [Paenisporosarcina sp. TG20]
MSRALVYAHRGASGHELENSYAAFVKAVELGADGLEIDLQLTKDLVPIVTHDLDFWRLARTHRKVSSMNYEEVKKLKLGIYIFRLFNGSSILTFEEVLAFAKENNLALNVELKETFVDAPSQIDILSKRSYTNINIHFSSFHYEVLERIKKCNPLIQTAYIGTKKTNWEELSQLWAADALHIHKRYYKTDRLDLAFQSNMPLRFYGIDGYETYLSNPHPAVIGWITDFPGRVLMEQKKKEF